MDQHFDTLGQRLKTKFYQSNKGWLRLELIWRHLNGWLNQQQHNKPIRILDAGCGLGQMATRLASLGHRVTACDPAAGMIAEAQSHAERQGVTIDFRQQSVQDLLKEHKDSFDLVLAHAVLEWLAEPQSTLQQLTAHLNKGGALSLAFYNVHSLVFLNLIKGNFNKVRSNQYAGDGTGLTPIHPLDPDQVFNELADAGMQIEEWRGIRCFHDYIYPRFRDRPRDDLIQLEWQFSNRDPYRGLARYTHIIATRTSR